MNEASVLVVEDDPAIAGMLTLMLELHGHSAHVAPSGQAALEYLCPDRTTPEPGPPGSCPPEPGLLLLDLHLTDMDGVSLVKHLKERGCSVPPIIVLSAKGQRVVAEAARIIGAADYFLKPADMDLLMSSVAKVLSRAPQDPAIAVPPVSGEVPWGLSA